MDDVTATLRGLTIGGGTDYRWAEWPQGLLGTPPVRVADQPRARRNGVIPGDDLLDARTIVFTIVIPAIDRAAAEQAATDLSEAFAPGPSDEWLDVRIAGSPGEYSLLGRPRGCEIALGRRFVSGVIDARCVFVATDPIRYGAEQSLDLQLTSGGDGLEYPVTYPVVYAGSGGTATGSAANAGTTAVDWVATLTGPLTNPRLEHIESGRFIRVAATLSSTQTLVLDSASGGLLLGGTTPRPSWFGAGSRWFQLDPGSNSLRLTADSGLGSAAITWRPGWA